MKKLVKTKNLFLTGLILVNTLEIK
jgi:hypothetical protein